jgi:hypothetical protein
MTPTTYANPLAFNRRRLYASAVAKKNATEFDSSNYTKAHEPRNAAFLRVYVIASFSWAAVMGSIRAAGFLCVRSVNPVICCPPRLTAGGGLTAHKGGSYA